MRWPLAVFVCGGLGLATGGAGRWLDWRSKSARLEAAARSGGGGGGGGSGMARNPHTAGVRGKSGADFQIPAVSEDGPRLSVEDLLKLSGLELTDRLARWLPGATVDELARLVRSRNDPDRNIDAEDAIYLRWAELDPEGAVKFATAKGYPDVAWWAWGQVDPDKAVAAAGKNPRSTALALVLRAIADDDPEKARRLGEKYPAAYHSRLVQEAAAGKMAREDPAGAVEMAYRAGSWEARKIVGKWAAADPDGALEWARTVPHGEEKTALMRSILAEWAASQPQKIAEALDRLPPGGMRTALMKDEALRLSETDPQAALDYATSAKNAPRLTLMDAVLQRVATTEPARALAALGQLEPADWADAERLSGTLRALGQSGGAQAMAWLASPQGSAAMASGANTQNRVFGGWMNTSPEAATAWLAAQPAETRPVACVTTAVSILTSGSSPDFDAALQWATTLPQGNHRTSTIQRVFSQWGARDPDAASKALERATFPEAERETLRQTIESWRPRR